MPKERIYSWNKILARSPRFLLVSTGWPLNKKCKILNQRSNPTKRKNNILKGPTVSFLQIIHKVAKRKRGMNHSPLLINPDIQPSSLLIQMDPQTTQFKLRKWRKMFFVPRSNRNILQQSFIYVIRNIIKEGQMKVRG